MDTDQEESGSRKEVLPTNEPAFLIRFCRQEVETGVDRRSATEGGAGIVVHSVDQPDRVQYSKYMPFSNAAAEI